MCKVEDQSELSPAPSELDVMDALAARCLTPGEAPYQVAVDAVDAFTPLLESEPHAGALYSVWGELTDAIELGATSRDEAEDKIRRFAASGWKCVADLATFPASSITGITRNADTVAGRRCASACCSISSRTPPTRRTGLPLLSAPAAMRVLTRRKMQPSTRKVDKGRLGARGGRCRW